MWHFELVPRQKVFLKVEYRERMQKHFQKYLVEFVGTFFFLFIIIATGHPLAIGAALALSIFLGGKISGGNFNPAVTVMMAAAKKIPTKDVVPYIVAQVAGGLLALEAFKYFWATFWEKVGPKPYRDR